VAIDANNNIFVGGVVGYGAVDFGGGPVGGVGMQNGFVLKLNSAGTYVWAKRILGAVVTDASNLRSLAVDSAGDVSAAGYFSGASDFGGGRRTCANGSGEMFVAKYAGANGAYRWDKTVDSTGFSGGYGVAADPNNGDLVVTGPFSGTADFGTGSISTSGGTAIFVARFSGSGGSIWTKSYGGSPSCTDVGSGVAIDAVGRIAVTGQITSMVDFGGGWLIGNGTANYFAVTLTSSGQYLWAKRVLPAIGNAAAFDSSLRLITVGQCGGSVDFGGGTVSLSSAAAFAVSYGP